MKNKRIHLLMLYVLVFLFMQYIAKAQGVYISTGGSITVVGSATILISDAGFFNNGTFTKGTETITFSGATGDTIAGSSATTFNDLTIDNTAGVSLISDSVTTISGVLTINNGKKLILPSSKQLTVSGTFTNNSDSSGFVIESSASGTGSLIHNTAGVSATQQRYMLNDSWHIISPAVLAQNMLYFADNVSNNIPTKTGNYGMMYYSESLGGWQYYTIPAAGTFDAGTGYLLRHTTDDAVSFYGALNSVNTDVNITQSANGWNSIGNPFPCSIGVRDDASTVESFITYNALAFDPSYAAIYLWDEPAVRVSGVTYYKLICNAGFTPTSPWPVLNQAYIQPGQGFIVKSAPGGATMTFTDAMRVHENTALFFKDTKASWPGINLSVKSAVKSASTAITFHENMTRGLDITYDAGILGGDPSFKLYSRLVEDNGIKFMLQCLPDYDFEDMIIPLGFDCTSGEIVSFSAEIIELPTGCRAFLEDRQLGIFTDLDKDSSAYRVEINESVTGFGRFYLHAYDIYASHLINNNSSDFLIYSNNKEIIVQGKISGKAHANLIDLTGRMIKTYELNPADLNILPANEIPTGVYILDISGEKLNENAKILLR